MTKYQRTGGGRGRIEFHDHEPKVESLRDAVIEGLSKDPRAIHSKFFYDQRGAQLFEEICTLDEYYPTRTEIGLLADNAQEIADLAGPDRHLIEFGSGASVKVRTLLDALKEPKSYVPIDISRDALLNAAEGFAKEFTDIPVVAVCADYTEPLKLPELDDGPRLGFFPGSTIGNFTREESVSFLSTAAQALDGGAMLVGVDLKKDEQTLNAAYNDARGVTAAFNRNLLHRINRELGSDFDPEGFTHSAVYRHDKGCVETHLVCDRAQTVDVCGHSFPFAEGDKIHTENSHKYSVGEFQALAKDGGFTPLQFWTDADDLFSIHYLEAA
ncbi:MAG: L-histidine N(alpha)-methyltransferase [Rhodospirillales bacterium]|nr:L-histidine N(alpha)-methyltransferase [Rhodospirillales bacterium]